MTAFIVFSNVRVCFMIIIGLGMFLLSNSVRIKKMVYVYFKTRFRASYVLRLGLD